MAIAHEVGLKPPRQAMFAARCGQSIDDQHQSAITQCRGLATAGALRAALMRLVSVESDTIRPPQIPTGLPTSVRSFHVTKRGASIAQLHGRFSINSKHCSACISPTGIDCWRRRLLRTSRQEGDLAVRRFDGQDLAGAMTDLFYWKEIERRARAAHALAMLHNSTDTDGINQANAILDELCLDRMGAERLIRSRMPRRRHSSRLAALALQDDRS
jgi:hypothetical protein